MNNQTKRLKKIMGRTKLRLQNSTPSQKLIALVFVLLFGGLGVYYLRFSSAASVTYTVPANIVSNCDPNTSTNQGPAINAWLDSIPNGASATSPNIIQFGANACYRLDSIIFAQHSNVIYEGNGATFKRFNSQNFGTGEVPYPWDGLYNKGYPFWAIGPKGNDTVQRVNITFRNMHVRGLNTVSDIDPTTIPGNYLYEPEKFGGHWTFGGYNAEFETGFSFKTIKGLTVDNLTTDGTWGDGVHVGSEHPVHLVTSAVVKNSTIDRNGRQGLTIGTVDGVVVDNVKIMHSHSSGIDIEVNGTGYSKNVEFKNMYINSKVVALAAGGIREASDIYIHDSVIRGAVNSWPWLQGGGNPSATERRKNWRAHRNTMIMPIKSPAFRFEMTDNIEIIDNIVAMDSSTNVNSTNKFPGVGLKNVGGTVTIKNNDFTSNGTTNGALYPENSGIFSADTATTASVDACGNKTTPATGFDQPTACTTSTPDTTNPTVSVTTPVNGATVTGTVNLTANASDNVGVNKVEFYNGSTKLGEDISSPYSYGWDTTKTTNGSYSLTAKAYDAAGNTSTSSPISVTVSNAAPDTTPPSVPSLSGIVVGPNQINVDWTTSTDNVGVSGYRLYRNGSLLLITTNLNYIDRTAQPSTSYSYTVSAYDAVGNESAKSTAVNLTTPAASDTTTPSAPTNLTASAISTQVNLNWNASTDNVGVTGYYVYRGSAIIAQTTSTSYSDGNVTGGTSYTYTVRARDAAGNVSSASNSVTATPPKTTADTTPPTVPTNLRTTKVRPNQVDLAWNASTDNVRVAGYRVFRNGSLVGTTSGTNFGDGSVNSSEFYTYTVVAYDAAGNDSTSSNSVDVIAHPAEERKRK